MKRLIPSLIVIGTLASLANCASGLPKPQQPTPINMGDRLVLPAGHPYIIPPEGIRFSNGASIGVPSDGGGE